MIPLKLKLNIAVKNKRKKILGRNVEGIICEIDNKYVVEYNIKDIEGFSNGLMLLPITEDSYSCINKTTVWFKDKKGKYIKLIRFADEAKVFNKPKPYIPFRPGYIAKGNLVNIDNKLYFRIIGCYHPIYGEQERKKINENQELYEV